MKNNTFLLTFLLLNIFFRSHAQNIWTQKTDFGGTSISGSVGFSIGEKGYIGTGKTETANDYKKDFWEFDPVSDTWTQKADFGGTARWYATGFSIGTKGYIGTGHDLFNYKNDFWEYDQSTNSWAQRANFPGIPRFMATGLSIGDRVYIGLGWDGVVTKKDFYEYNPSTDSWTKKANFGGHSRYAAVGFSIGNKGYMGTGDDAIYNDINDLWQYDPSTNSWTQKSDLPAVGRIFAIGFSMDGKGYVGTGMDNSYELLNDFWEYDTTTNAWTQKANFGGGGRWQAVGFAIGSKGYIGTGDESGDQNTPILQKDLWEYSTECDSVTVYADVDNDSYGDAASNSLIICDSILPTGYVYDNKDCNDADATIYPGAIEVCANGIDDNCDGQIDENCCGIPTGLTTTNITSTSAQLNWNVVASANKYKLQYKRDSIGASWITVTITAPTTTKTITGLLTNSKYKWKVRSVCGSEKSAFSTVVKFTTLLRLGEESVHQTSLTVYPNPVITSSTISFSVEESFYVSIELYDLAGRKIKTLVDDYLEEGNHAMLLNREQLGAGIYLLKVNMDGAPSIMKIIIQ